MADPVTIAVARKQAQADLDVEAGKLATHVGVDAPPPITGLFAKDEALREMSQMQGIVAFLRRVNDKVGAKSPAVKPLDSAPKPRK